MVTETLLNGDRWKTQAQRIRHFLDMAHGLNAAAVGWYAASVIPVVALGIRQLTYDGADLGRWRLAAAGAAFIASFAFGALFARGSQRVLRITACFKVQLLKELAGSREVHST